MLTKFFLNHLSTFSKNLSTLFAISFLDDRPNLSGDSYLKNRLMHPFCAA